MPYDNKRHGAVIACTSQLSLRGRFRVSISIGSEGPCFSSSSSNFLRELSRKCKSKKRKWRGSESVRNKRSEEEKGRNEFELYEYEIRGGGGSCQSRIFSRWWTESVKKRFIIKARKGIVNKRFMQIYPVAIFPVEKRDISIHIIITLHSYSIHRSGLFSYNPSCNYRSWLQKHPPSPFHLPLVLFFLPLLPPSFRPLYE